MGMNTIPKPGTIWRRNGVDDYIGVAKGVEVTVVKTFTNSGLDWVQYNTGQSLHDALVADFNAWFEQVEDGE
jgi:hypothetical protein